MVQNQNNDESKRNPTEQSEGADQPLLGAVENGVINTPERTIIINGGQPLNDCPTDLDEANKWQDEVNGDMGKWQSPLWRWDCGFKLDYDGPIIRISSRFYPPKSHYGSSWDGTVTVCIINKVVEEKEFDCKSLGELKTEVENYIDDIKARIEAVFN